MVASRYQGVLRGVKRSRFSDSHDGVNGRPRVRQFEVQYFMGETYFQTQAFIYSSSFTRWRKLCGAGRSSRLLLKKLKLVFAEISQWLIATLLIKIPSVRAA